MILAPCIDARDTITQADGHVLDNHYDYADGNHVITSSCRQDEGTWVAWINTGLGDSLAEGPETDKTAWPSRIASAYALGVGYFPDDGSAPVVYELAVEPCFRWSTEITHSDPCSYWSIVGDTFADSGCTHMTGWFMDVRDVQVRSDGSNVWVAALAREAVKYPGLYGPAFQDRCGVFHPSFEEYWNSGFSDPFGLDGEQWWIYAPSALAGTGSASGSLMIPPEFDDPGPDKSFRWQPARVTVWAGDIGGFTRLDAIEALFNNVGESDEYSSHALLSGLEAAASPAEPGVLHLLWAEGGNYGTRTINPTIGCS